MNPHRCHVPGCKAKCPPAHLMCPIHWAKVPPDLQGPVTLTFQNRGRFINRAWAPWWRAAHRAIFAVMPQTPENQRWLDKQLDFADQLEGAKKRPSAERPPDAS